MGWGIKYSDYLNKIHPRELESKIEDAENYIKSLEFDLVGLSASSPHEVKDSEGGIWGWIDYVTNKVKTTLEELQEQYVLLYKYRTCLNDTGKVLNE